MQQQPRSFSGSTICSFSAPWWQSEEPNLPFRAALDVALLHSKRWAAAPCYAMPPCCPAKCTPWQFGYKHAYWLSEPLASHPKTISTCLIFNILYSLWIAGQETNEDAIFRRTESVRPVNWFGFFCFISPSDSFLLEEMVHTGMITGTVLGRKELRCSLSCSRARNTARHLLDSLTALF